MKEHCPGLEISVDVLPYQLAMSPIWVNDGE